MDRAGTNAFNIETVNESPMQEELDLDLTSRQGGADPQPLGIPVWADGHGGG
jgi:hypothetical protein